LDSALKVPSRFVIACSRTEHKLMQLAQVKSFFFLVVKERDAAMQGK
jgi:hypothetical protein